ncbi:hypothetical protein PFISCL1PPCAC_11323, partial [Pristionchus fissidentatus]
TALAAAAALSDPPFELRAEEGRSGESCASPVSGESPIVIVEGPSTCEKSELIRSFFASGGDSMARRLIASKDE